MTDRTASPAPILPYQSRLLTRNSSSSSGNVLSSTSSGDVGALAGSKRASFTTPLLNSSASLGGSASGSALGRKDSMMGGAGHRAGAKSIDLVRGKWEQRAVDTQQAERGRTPSFASPPMSPTNRISTPNMMGSPSTSVKDRKALLDANDDNVGTGSPLPPGSRSGSGGRTAFMDTVGDSRRQKARSYMPSSGSGNLDKEIAAILAGTSIVGIGAGAASGSAGNRNSSQASSVLFPDSRSTSFASTTSSPLPRHISSTSERNFSSSPSPAFLTPLADIPKRNTSADEDSLELLTRIKAQLAEEEERTRRYDAGIYGNDGGGAEYDPDSLERELQKLELDEKRREEELRNSLDRLLGVNGSAQGNGKGKAKEIFETDSAPKVVDSSSSSTPAKRQSWRKPSPSSTETPSTPVRRMSAALSANPIYNPSPKSTVPNFSSTPQHQQVSKSGFRNIITPPKAMPLSKFPETSVVAKPSGLGRGLPSSAVARPGSRLPSIGKSDGRRLGKHLPRIASGHEGHVDDDADLPLRNRGEERDIAKPTAAPEASSKKPDLPSSGLRKERPQSQGASALRSLWESTAVQSTKENAPTGPKSMSLTRGNSVVAGSKRTSFNAGGQGVTGPVGKIVPDGRGMEGLFGKDAVVGASRPGFNRQESIAGAPGRIRLSRLPLASTSASLAPAPLPSKKLTLNWMDRQRKELGAYEYLCHVGEAQQWIEGCLDEELGYGVVEMEECMRDGVALAKLARVYQGADVVRTIWEDKKHRFRQSDNINYFLTWVREIGLPETFIFELTDLYDKKNIPKVIFCIHTLSHLLARLGKAEKMGNLVGQFDFSDEQLAHTQKGLQGVAMPNFAAVGAALAKECDFEPEEDQETEEEERDRLLLECEGDIKKLQTALRSHLAQQRASRLTTQLALAQKSVVVFQSRARGALDRRIIRGEITQRQKSSAWVTGLQAHIRGNGTRVRWQGLLRTIGRLSDIAIPLQACCRAALAQKRLVGTQMTMHKQRDVVIRLQAAARAKASRNLLSRKRNDLRQASYVDAVSSIQAQSRGLLARNRCDVVLDGLRDCHYNIIAVQARIRGALVRRNLRVQVQSLDDATDVVIAIQACARRFLARQRHSIISKALSSVQPAIVSFQSLARAKLRSRQHADMRKSLAKIETTVAVGTLQALLRSKLAKRSTVEQKKQLDVVMPDVVGLQAQARGVLARREHREWVGYLHDDETQGGISFLQQLLRGHMARKRFMTRVWQIRHNLPNIIKAQALWRGRKQRQTYQKVISGLGVDVAAIQNFMHLLEDSETDFTEDAQIEHLRRKVVERIRGNQLLESQVTELDTKIALILQNRLSFEDLVRVKKLMGHMAQDQEQPSFEVAHMDPFSHGATLERSTRRKLELYQHMFFLLQTEPRYLGRLLRIYSDVDPSDQRRRTLQGTTLALFGFAQGRREEFLLLKVLQLGLHEQIVAVPDIHALIDARPIVLEVTLAFVRSQNESAIKGVLQAPIQGVLKQPDLDLCIDPVAIYHRILNDEETESGVISTKERNVDAYHAVHVDPSSGKAFYRQLMDLQVHTDALLRALYASTAKFPFAIRFAAREMLLALRVKTQYQMADEALTPIIARLLVLPYLTPALIAPDSQGISTDVIEAISRQNLSEMAKLVARVGAGPYRAERLDPNIFGALESFIAQATPGFSDWILELASVDDVETHLNTETLVEVAAEPRPITLTRAEIYSVHSSVAQYAEDLATRSEDPIRAILLELGGVPQIYQEGQTAPVTLILTARFAQIKDDPFALQKAEWNQAKRHVLASLRVQTGRTLVDVLTAPVTEEVEMAWEDIVMWDLERERARKRKSQLPVPPAISNEYRMDDIRTLRFREVKARAIQFCMHLEKEGVLTRENDWQDLLNDMAADIRSNNKNRQRRRKEFAAMSEAFGYASDKQKALEEQMASYNEYVNSAMNTMQKQGKKKPLWPFSKQARHLQSMKKAGKSAKFGSFKFSALEMYEQHVLLPKEGFSPKQFEKLSLILSSDQVGIFTLELVNPSAPVPTLGSCEIRMEDLLQAKFENKPTLDMFDQVARVRLTTLIFLINKKFYS